MRLLAKGHCCPRGPKAILVTTFPVYYLVILTTAPVIIGATATDEETEAQKGWVTCSRPHSSSVLERGLNLSSHAGF